jgi:CheY-like chemotaxis protein
VYVDCNEAKLSQVLINLLLNALDAMESSNAQSNRLSIRLRREQNTALIEVSDTGTGISKQVLNEIFNPFFTTKPVGKGLGLGLAMSHRLITGMGGSIVPTSELGVGSTFLVSLPAVDPPQPQAPVADNVNPGAMATGRILIIDDLPQVAKVLARMLRRHDVTATNTADEALKQIQDNEFDAILCDIMMPSMTGLELWNTVQTIRPALAARFIFVTGGIFSEVDQESAQETGCAILTKPVRRKELQEAVQALLMSGKQVSSTGNESRSID